VLRHLLPDVLLQAGEVPSVRTQQLLQQQLLRDDVRSGLCGSRELLPGSESRLLRTGPGLCSGVRRSGCQQVLPGSGGLCSGLCCSRGLCSGLCCSRGLCSGLCCSCGLLPEDVRADLCRSDELLLDQLLQHLRCDLRRSDLRCSDDLLQRFL
jgi:hypothetical protein